MNLLVENKGVEKVTKIETTTEYIKIFYTITDEFQKENELCYKNRVLRIDLKTLQQIDSADPMQI